MRRQIDAVLTPEQLDAYRTLAVQQFAPGILLYQPQALKNIAMTPEQTEKLRQMRKRPEQDLQKRVAQALAVLTPQQREKVRPRAEQGYRRSHEPAPKGTGVWLSTDADWSYQAEGAAHTDYLKLPVYEQLGQARVRETLGFGTTQEMKLREIAGRMRDAGEHGPRGVAEAHPGTSKAEIV